MTEQPVDPNRQALIDQINSLREQLKTAQEQTLKVQDSFEAVKKQIHDFEHTAEDEITATKAEGQELIHQLSVEIERCHSEARSQIKKIREELNNIVG